MNIFIIQKNEQELVLGENKWVSRVLLVISLLVSIVLAPVFLYSIIVAALTVTSVDCQRVGMSQVDCQVYRTGFMGMGQRESIANLSGIKQAIFTQTKERDRNNASITLVDNQLILRDRKGSDFSIQDFSLGDEVLKHTNGNEQALRNLEKSLNNFIQSNQKELSISVSNIWNLSNLALMLMVVGFTLLMIIPISKKTLSEKIIFNKAEQKIKHQKIRLLGTEQTSIEFEEIREIIINQYSDDDGDQRYSVVLPKHRGGEFFSLHFYGNENNAKKIAEEISLFLGVEIKTVKES